MNGGADRDGAALLHIKARAPIDVHYWPTPNGWKVTIMLEECRASRSGVEGRYG
jgi:hypothetical protein